MAKLMRLCWEQMKHLSNILSLVECIKTKSKMSNTIFENMYGTWGLIYKRCVSTKKGVRHFLSINWDS